MDRISQEKLTFISIVRAGLWDKDIEVPEGVDYSKIFQLASEQSVIGIVSSGLEKVGNDSLPKDVLFPFISQTLQIEQRNIAMNDFIARLMERLEKNGITALLVKGQGIAQCYLQPLWRTSGDVDLLLDEYNYRQAIKVLTPIANSVYEENLGTLHYAMDVGIWEVELHGTLRNLLNKKMDTIVDKVQQECFVAKRFRKWKNGKNDVLLPCPDDDVIFVFSHILQHFFRGGIGLRQICDWCRLIWTYRDSIDMHLLEARLLEGGMMSEWKAFASLSVFWLGMPRDAMPLFSAEERWKRKALIILAFIFETGNFGQNRDVSYYKKYPFLIRKCISLGRHTWDSMRYCLIFPKDSIKVWMGMFYRGIKSVFYAENR